MTSYFNTAEQLTETITSEPTVTVIDQFDLLTGWVSYEAQYQANGPLVQIFYDPENTQSWSSIQRAWTNANATNAVSQTTTYDDGRRQVLSWDQKANSIQTETDYNTDGSYKVTWWDTENSNSWSSWWATYDSSGRLAQDMAYNDDGTSTLNVFDPRNGEVQQENTYRLDGTQTDSVYDTEGAQPWSSYYVDQNASGANVDQKVWYRDGEIAVNTFDTSNGKVSSSTQYFPDRSAVETVYDTEDNQPWSYVSNYVNSLGQSVQDVMQNPDGSWSQEYFDPQNQNPWQTVQYVHAANGQVEEETSIGDNGAKAVWFYDVYSQFTWKAQEIQYDANGQMIESQPNDPAITIWNDDGSTVQTSFGIRDLQGTFETWTIINEPNGDWVKLATGSLNGPTVAGDGALFGTTDWTGGSAGAEFGDVAIDPMYGSGYNPALGNFNPNASVDDGLWAYTYDGGTPVVYITDLEIDPLVLNLDGQDVTTTSAATNGVTFDMRGDGASQPTGWITPEEAFLVMGVNDPNAVTSGHDLISDVNQLAGLDTNHDGVIDADDTDYGSIKLWEPGSNGSGAILESLAARGIAKIILAPTASDRADNGNHIKQTFQFIYSNGTIGQGADVFFATGPDLGGSNPLPPATPTAADLPSPPPSPPSPPALPSPLLVVPLNPSVSPSALLTASAYA
ncbi:MAG TPA: hypothetical protein VJ779_08615 [Acetobacteraceae bacterium]|nr:hypothetical protein [Acetobacteraceae bacterium]